jgi:hypothetical protein
MSERIHTRLGIKGYTEAKVAAAVALLVDPEPQFEYTHRFSRREGEQAYFSFFFETMINPETGDIREADITVMPHQRGGYQVFFNPEIIPANLITERSVRRELKKVPALFPYVDLRGNFLG